MQKKFIRHRLGSMLVLMIGVVFAFGCKNQDEKVEVDLDKLMTQQSDSLTIIESKNGNRTQRFFTPLLERYEQAKEPYTEFRKGVNVITYKDSTEIVESTLVADYAIHLEKQQLWEAKGNVKTTNAQGQQLETQQLFWNQRTKKIYSNVDSKLTQNGDVIIGIGFEANEDFSDFTFRRPKGKVSVDVSPTDTTAQNTPAPVSPAPASVSSPAGLSPQLVVPAVGATVAPVKRGVKGLVLHKIITSADGGEVADTTKTK